MQKNGSGGQKSRSGGRGRKAALTAPRGHTRKVSDEHARFPILEVWGTSDEQINIPSDVLLQSLGRNMAERTLFKASASR